MVMAIIFFNPNVINDNCAILLFTQKYSDAALFIFSQFLKCYWEF